MDPSHARRYRNTEIEVIVARILSFAYPTGINIPIDIDWIAESNEKVGNIVPADLLEDKFKVAAVLISKPDACFDIFVDDNTITYKRARSNFSIAHEFGHIMLHDQVCAKCYTIDTSILLRNRIAKSYPFIERNANYFAGAILIPRRTILEDTARVYEALVQDIGYDTNLIPEKLCSTLARRYAVNFQPMEIRLRELNLHRKIQVALRESAPYIDP